MEKKKEINIEKIANSVSFFKEMGYNVSVLSNGKVYGHNGEELKTTPKELVVKTYYLNRPYIFGGFPKTKDKLVKDITKLFK